MNSGNPPLTVQLSSIEAVSMPDLGKVFNREEEATLLLWAWPELIGWRTSVDWLFSPVVGQKWPGDLWGIDQDSNLLLVETKKATRPQDPLKDFVDYLEKQPVRGQNPVTAVNLIKERWVKRLELERSFIRRSMEDTSNLAWWDDRHPGVVPYSSKRLATRKWRHVYLEQIAPSILDPQYISSIQARLRRRSRAGGEVHFIGLFSVAPGSSPRLSQRGDASLKELKRDHGPRHVHLRALGVRENDPDSIELVGWTPSFDDA